MSEIDEWLKTWLSANDLAKSGEYRSPGPLHVYAMTAVGAGPQFSGPLQAWEGLVAQLARGKVTLGLVAVETELEDAYFKYPGVTLAFESPFGGTAVARDVRGTLTRLDTSAVLLNEDLRALQRNWLFRRYFKEQAKEQEKLEKAAE